MDPIAYDRADTKAPHLAGSVRNDPVIIIECDAKPAVGKNFVDHTLDGQQFLDIPILLVIVSLGALRPSDWTQFLIGIVTAVVAASLLNYFIPRLYPWGGDEGLTV